AVPVRPGSCRVMRPIARRLWHAYGFTNSLDVVGHNKLVTAREGQSRDAPSADRRPTPCKPDDRRPTLADPDAVRQKGDHQWASCLDAERSLKTSTRCKHTLLRREVADGADLPQLVRWRRSWLRRVPCSPQPPQPRQRSPVPSSEKATSSTSRHSGSVTAPP